MLDADTYFKSRFNSDLWFELSDEDKQKALDTAQRRIYLLPFIGNACDMSCPFPRYIGGKVYEMPDCVEYAIYEEAYSIVDNNIVVDKNVRSISLGSASVTFSDNPDFEISQKAKEYLSGWIRTGFEIPPDGYIEIY